MNNLTSYGGLVDAKIRASDKDLPAILQNFAGHCQPRSTLNILVIFYWNFLLEIPVKNDQHIQGTPCYALVSYFDIITR